MNWTSPNRRYNIHTHNPQQRKREVIRKTENRPFESERYGHLKPYDSTFSGNLTTARYLMKKLPSILIIAVAILASGRAFAQLHIEPHNFYWQRVVEYKGARTEMRDRIVASGIFSDIQRNDSTMIVGRVDNVLLNYATMEPEPRLFDKPIFFRNGEKFSGTLTYELKEGRYRVTFKNLIYNSDMVLNVGGMSVDMRNQPVNKLFYKSDGSFCRGTKAQQFAREVFDYSFSNSFIIKDDDELQSEEW